MTEDELAAAESELDSRHLKAVALRIVNDDHAQPNARVRALELTMKLAGMLDQPHHAPGDEVSARFKRMSDAELRAEIDRFIEQEERSMTLPDLDAKIERLQQLRDDKAARGY